MFDLYQYNTMKDEITLFIEDREVEGLQLRQDSQNDEK